MRNLDKFDQGILKAVAETESLVTSFLGGGNNSNQGDIDIECPRYEFKMMNSINFLISSYSWWYLKRFNQVLEVRKGREIYTPYVLKQCI